MFKLVILFLISFSIFATGDDPGGIGGGVGGTKPTKDERTSPMNINIGKVQVINLATKFGDLFNSNLSSPETIASGRRLTVPTHHDFSYTKINTNKDLMIKLDQIEEVTLNDGTVLSKEEILESLNTKN